VEYKFISLVSICWQGLEKQTESLRLENLNRCDFIDLPIYQVSELDLQFKCWKHFTLCEMSGMVVKLFKERLYKPMWEMKVSLSNGIDK
jgi:hypothetical protein